MRTEVMGPGIHGPSLRWYKPSGFVALVLRTLWRFWITGRPVRGRGDNASFLHDATIDFRKGPVERLSRARWRRLAWRWAVAGVPLTLFDLHWWVTWWPLLGYATVGVSLGGFLIVIHVRAWWPQRAVRREFILPTWTVVCRIIAEKPSKRAAIRAVVLPAGWGLEHDDETGEAPELVARINLPMVPLDQGVQNRIASEAGRRLGIPDVQASWTVRGARAHVDLQPRVLPPRSLRFADVRDLVLAADPRKPFAGLAAGRTPVHADLDNDGPHMGVSGGTGTGKSTLTRLLLAQRVRAGSRLVACDYKIISQPWAARIAKEAPGRVQYLTEEDEIHEGIMRLFGEFQRRRAILREDVSRLDELEPIDLLIEELNTLASMLRMWWQHERRRAIREAKDMDIEPDAQYLSAVCPSVIALAALVQMGREFNMRVHFAAQRLDASALSPKDGGAIRESITNRFLAKYTRQTWDMLCKGVPYLAFPGGPRGIWVAVVNDEATAFRVPLMTNDEAYELAMGITHATGPALVTIRQAVEAMTAGPSLDAARKAVQRAALEAKGKDATGANLFDRAALEGILAS